MNKLSTVEKQLCCAFYHGNCCANNKNSFKFFFYQMIDAEARRFEVMITSLLLTLK